VSAQPKPWTVIYSPAATKTLDKLEKRDRATVTLIRDAMRAIGVSGLPRSRGKALTEDRAGQWRYRIGDWRVIAELKDRELIIRAVEVGHRSTIYRNRRKR